MYETFTTPVLEQKSTSRILLVEDNDTTRQLLSDLLNSYGYEVCSINDGTNFFSVLSDFCPHIVLLDLKLPIVDGYTLLQQLQDCPKSQDIPVIVLSALAFKMDRERAMRLGAKHYLIKPVALEQLIQLLDQYSANLVPEMQ